MIQESISIIDPLLKSGITEDFILIAKLSDNKFSYTIFDCKKNKFSALCSWNKDEKKDNVSSWLVRQNFGKALILIDTIEYSWIPGKLFDPEFAKKYLSFNHVIDLNEHTHNDFISTISAHNIYRIPFDTEQFISKNVMHPQYMHITTSLVNAALLDVKNDNKLWLNFSEKRMDVVAISEKSLQLCNSFTYTSATDLIYFLLNIISQLKINNAVPVKLIGNIDKESEILGSIQKYFKNVSFVTSPENYAFHDEIKEIPSHYYFSLFNAML